MNGTWVFTINKDDEKLLDRARKETGISADYRASTGKSYNESLLAICCEDDDAGCVLMESFLGMRGEGSVQFKEDPEAFTKLRLRAVV